MTAAVAPHREVGRIALLFTALGSIIGSGWLFGAWRAAQLAGPGAVYAWIIGAVIILFVALTFAELGALFPESGGSIRYGFYSHGSLVGFVAGWATWIAVVSVIPVEAEASRRPDSSSPRSWSSSISCSIFGASSCSRARTARSPSSSSSCRQRPRSRS